MIKLPEFKQGDPRWGSDKLGDTQRTLASDGCYITSIAAILNPQFAMTPAEVNAYIKKINGFTDDGQVWWWAVEKMTEGRAVFIERVYTTCNINKKDSHMQVEVAINKVRRYLDLGCATILCADAIKNDNIPDHAVVAIDYKLDVDKVVDFLIIDPAYGDTVWYSKRFGSIYQKLFGYVGLSLPTAQFPDQSMFKDLGQAFWKACQLRKGKGLGTYPKEIADSFLSVE